MTKVFTISIGGTTELNSACAMRNVGCRVSIVNEATGMLLAKSSNDRKVFSTYEETEFIPQAVTKFVNARSPGSSVISWNESIYYNELFSHICKQGVIFIFEIIDYTIYPHARSFFPLAWGYLKLHNQNGEIVNEGKQRTLQLYEYPSNFQFDKNRAKVNIFESFSTKVKVDALLSVKITHHNEREVENTKDRPQNPFQNEVGKEDFSEIIKKEDKSDSDSVEIDESERSDVGVCTKCTIPRNLKTQLFPGERGALCVRFSHDGLLLAVAVQKNRTFFVDFYNTDNFQLINSVPAHVDNIYEISFSANDTTILTASGDGMAKVININGPPSPIVLPHAKFIYTAKFHPQDNRYVFTAGYDGIIRVWDTKAEKLLKEFHGHESRINSIVFSPNGKRLYAGDANGLISVWKTNIEKNGLEGLKCKNIIKDDEVIHSKISHLEMVRSNYSLLVHTQDDMIRVFDTKAMTTTQRYIGAKCKNFRIESTYSPDGAYVLSGSEDGNILLWTVKMSKSAHVLQWTKKFDKPVTTVAWNPKRNQVAFSSFADGQPVLVFDDPDEPTVSIASLDVCSDDENHD